MKTLVNLVSILALLFTVCNCQTYDIENGCATTNFTDCSDQVKDLCSREGRAPCPTYNKCNTTVGGNHFAFPRINNHAQKLIQAHIQASMDFLLMGSVYSEWKENRKGFQSYFEKLSDSAWEDSIALLQHVTVRGGSLLTPLITEESSSETIKDELTALSKGLDIQKDLLHKSLDLMNTSPTVVKYEEHADRPTLKVESGTPPPPVQSAVHPTVKKQKYSDAEFSHFLAGEVSGKLIHRVKDLANHVHLLSEALNQDDVKRGVVVHLYDTQIIS